MAEQFDCTKFACLELLPTSLLEEIIRTDFSGEANYSEDMIQYVLEVIVRRRKEEQPDTIPNVQEAWKKLQLRMDAEDSVGLSEYLPSQKGKCSKRGGNRILRYVALVAACVAIIFATLITVQAMGVDIFGALGTWTDETFRFEVTQEETAGGSESSNRIEDPVVKALFEMGLPTAFAPTWIPEGYELIEVAPIDSVLNKGVAITYAHAGVEHNFIIDICEYYDIGFLHDTLFEKNKGAPEEYQNNGRRFYLFRNCDVWTAAWSDGRYSIALGGIGSRETVISIIDSIQEVTYE